MVMAEVDVAANGKITVVPNPVEVASGENLFFHVRSNASDASKLTAHFPGGQKSPFGAMDMDVTMTASVCTAGGTLVRWPPDVNSARVTLSAHGSPEFGKLEVEIRRGTAVTVDERGQVAPSAIAGVTPQGPAGDQAYAITIADSKITTDSKITYAFDPGSGCVKVQSSAISDGEAVVVVECVKDGGKCKECETTVKVSVLDKDTNVLVTKSAKINCHP